jgi:acetylglutamate kinase
MALGFDGEYYNINADEMAAACAIACHADALVFLTDVPGVKGATARCSDGSPSIRSPRWPRAPSSPAACCPS